MSSNRPVVGSVTTEGVALVYNQEGSKVGVTTGTKVANQNFAGIALFQMRHVRDTTTMPRIVTLDSTNVKATKTGIDVNLGVQPVPATYNIVKNNAVQGTIDTTTANGSTVSIDMAGATEDEIQATYESLLDATISFEFVPTVTQWKSMYGDVIAGDAPGVVWKDVGIVTQGDVYTTEWDTTADWSKANDVTKALAITAGGKITLADKTAKDITFIPNAFVISLPTSELCYLGITLA